MTPVTKQQGFTLIELIVVIVILGILAATALPKFINLSTDARVGAMKGVMAAMQSANNMLYGKASAQNQAGATGTVNTPTAIALVYGYASTVAQLQLALDLTASDFGATTTPATAGAQGVIYHKGSLDTGLAASASQCRIEYTIATATTTPVYTQLTSGC